MIYGSTERIFDTLIDTNKNYVSIMIKTKVYLRKDYSRQNENLLCLSITKAGYARVRFGLELYVEEKYWDDKNCRIICGNDKELQDKQLVLDNIKSKLTSIATSYRLSDKVLTPSIMRDEYENKISRINFIAFFHQALQEEKSKFTAGTYVRHLSVYHKLKEYQSYTPFNELNISWFNRYRTYLKNKGNKDTTINGNFSSIRKWLGLAVKNGVKLQFNLDDFEVGDTRGNRNYLSAKELNSMMEFYFSHFIKPQWKLILGYFLFACMNGLRITNVLQIDRSMLMDTDLSIVMIKGNKDRIISMNDTVRKIVTEEPALFLKKVTQNEINIELKKIAVLLGIRKKISFHVSRHTFATLFIKQGGKVEMLQQLLGHSDIKQTMIYVHIVMEDANEEVYRLDKLFKFDGNKFIA